MKSRTYKEMAATALGWWLFFSVNLIMGLAVITVVQSVRSGLDWRLALPVLLKWEFLLLSLSVFSAVVLQVYKGLLMRFLPFGGFFRTFIVYFTAYVGVIIILPFLPFGGLQVLEIESNLALVMILLIIVRLFPQKYFKDPEGPILSLPVEDALASEVNSFGIFQSGLEFEREFGTPIYAAADGVVKMTWPFKNDGMTVKILHEDKFSTVYAHLSEVAVEYGKPVQRGDLIGYVGNTGHSFTPHLHFEVRYRDRIVDPQVYLEQKSRRKKGQQGKKDSKK